MANQTYGEIVETLTLTELCQSCDVREDWIIELVDQGILEPQGASATRWRFTATSMTITVKAQRLQRDLGINLPGIALVLSLLKEKERLRQRLQMLENITDALDADVEGE